MSQKPCKIENPIFTYQTYAGTSSQTSAILEACAVLMSHVTHKLIVDMMAQKNLSELKREYIQTHQITARQFNSCRISVEGIIRSQKELQIQRIHDIKATVDRYQQSIIKLNLKKKNRHKVYLKRRKINHLKHKLDKLKNDLKQNKIRICFGTRKKFHAQFDLEKSGYANHEEWKQDWHNSRNNAFFLVGSKDETSGNQSCVATIQPDGKISLRLRIPDALNDRFGKYLVIPNVYFSYGHKHIVAAIHDCQCRNELKKNNDLQAVEHGVAINYRFKKDEDKGWYIYVSLAMPEPEWISHNRNGVIGVDINTDHLAVTELDCFGNPLKSFSLPLNLYGKSTHQSKATIGDACAELIKYATSAKKDIVLEKLDFSHKKADMDKFNPAQARILSSFAYSNIIQTIKSRAWRFGVHVHQVNPRYTSIIGRIKYAYKYGRTVHQAAALCIARRFFGFSERSPHGQVFIPDSKGGHVAFQVPVRNRGTNLWSHWGLIGREIQAVHAAQIRAAKSRSINSKPIYQMGNPSNIASANLVRESLAILFG